MKPEFALSLSPKGIRLLQRSEDGWLSVGAVSLGSNSVEADLAQLRTKAELLAREGPLRTKLILPNSEILYEQTSIGGATGPDYEALVREALDGRTPYALEELCYDYVVSGQIAQIAVVARETLIEAEDFAVAHGFNPVSFAAIPPKNSFAGEPMFGTTRAAVSLLTAGTDLARDAVPVVVVGKAGDESAGPATNETKNAPQDERGVAKTAEGKPRIPPAPVGDTRPLAQTGSVASPSADSAPKLKTAPLAARPALLTFVGILAVLLIAVSVVLVGREDAETAATANAPEPDVQTALIRPEQAEPAAPTVQQLGLPQAPPASADTVLADTAPDGPAQPLSSTTEPPQIESVTAPEVMLEMENTLVAPQPNQLTAFEQTPQPEEVAEGAEALPEGTPQSLVAATVDRPEGLAPAPIAGAGPGLLEAETFYAVTGIWQRSPEQPASRFDPDLSGLYVASLDAEIDIDDALALPSYEEGRDGLFETPQPPFAPGLVFDLDENGRVIATPDGALSPDGVMIFEGGGEARPRERPFNALPDTSLGNLAQIRPAPRPSNARELVERATLDGRTRSELAALSPRPRPASEQQQALAVAETAPSALAVARAPSPPPRPSGIDAIVAEVRAAQARQAQQQQPDTARTTGAAASTASLARAAPVAPAPAIPTTASVARQATLENAIRLDRLNLIGVYGSRDDRRALVRTPAGRYVKVQVGDRLDGGRVAVIGEASLQYTKGTRNILLEVPNG